MKRYTLFIIALLATVIVSAQSHIRVWKGGEDNKMSIAKVGDITFKGSQMTIKEVTYALTEVDSIVVVPEITVTYNGNTATVNVPEAIKKDVTVQVDGANVTLTNNNVSNEVDLILSGESNNGSFTYVGRYKCSIFLQGLNLTSQKGAAIDIQCGKRIAMTLVDGTTNSLTDAAAGTQKACLYCKGHLEVEGSGTLNITGNAKHGIATKEYLQLKKSTGSINILKAASDAIHAGQYFQMNGGTISIDSNTAADGIQAEYVTLDDDITPDPEEENNGQIIIKGGTINATIAHEDCKAIKADALITISGGTFDLKAQGNGSRGIQTDGSLVINQESNTTSITILAAGGKCTLDECAADPHKCMGIKVDGNMDVYAGTLNVTATGKKAKTVKVGGTYNAHGNTLNVGDVDAATIIL